MATNPFRPTAGSSPPEIIARQPLLDGIAESLANGPGSPARISIFTGQRGVGKTVMLNEASDLALRHGWHSINLTATPGLLTRLDAEVTRLAEREDPPPKGKLTGVHLPGGLGVEVERTATLSTDVRANLSTLLDILATRQSGLLLTLDEVHGGATTDLRELAALTQHMIREDREFAVVMAGLPAAVSSLLSDQVLTFLRRADRHELAALPIDDVQDALEKTMTDNGRRLDPELSRVAAQGTRGYPFLVQLVGYHIWRNARTDRIGPAAVNRGVADARARLGSLVHETALQDLSEVDRRFLVAMAEDEGRSRVSDVARRMAKDRHYVNTYRRRLISARVIEEAGRGYLTFAIPYLRDYLRDEYDASR